MPVHPTDRPYDMLAQKWSQLADRRRAHFIELYKTGRWKHYYSEAEFVIRLREVFHAAEEWQKLASPHGETKTAN